MRDSFYMATTNSDGYVSGTDVFFNLDGNDRVALFLMDYPNRERLRILGHAKVLDAREQPALADQLTPTPEMRSKIERLFLIEVMSFDWNCPQYITPRFTEAEVETHIAPFKARIAELETQLSIVSSPSRQT